MATYAIGDLQGCLTELKQLLKKIRFNPGSDQLWFAGDLINRGPESLETLRYVRDLGASALSVLGNHDLHLLAVAHGFGKPKPRDTLDPILDARDRDDLLGWLRRCPLLHHDNELGFTLVHAGLPPQWDLQTASQCAREVETVLAGAEFKTFFNNMYGNEPDTWSAALSGIERLRFSINAFTRLRYCDAGGRMDFNEKSPPGSQPADLIPWFDVPRRRSKKLQILFGHWSTLSLASMDYSARNIYPLDTGCVWGGALTALRLEDQTWFSVPSQQKRR